MKSSNGQLVQYELVYCFSKKNIYRYNGIYFIFIGSERGILIRSNGPSGVMHHLPSDYLQWKHETVNK